MLFHLLIPEIKAFLFEIIFAKRKANKKERGKRPEGQGSERLVGRRLSV